MALTYQDTSPEFCNFDDSKLMYSHYIPTYKLNAFSSGVSITMS